MANHPFSGVSYEDVVGFDTRTLNSVMEHGGTPTREQLAGWELRGFNPPAFTKVLGIQKFVKGFFVDERGLAGYNLFVEDPREGLHAPWRPKKDGEPSTRHGFYDVKPVHKGDRYDEFENAVLLDYGSGRNHKLDPEGRIRDYLVQVDPENDELFLGKAYLELGITSVHVNFFIIERFRRAPDAQRVNAA